MEIFSLESVDSQLLLSGPGFEPCSSVKSNPTVASYSENAGQECQTSETSEQQTFWNGEEESMFSQADSHASPSVLPGSEEARTMTEISGRQCAMLCPRSGLFGSFVKTCLESSAWGNSSEFVWIWTTSVTRHNRLLFQLTPSGPSIEDSGYLLWRTPDANIDRGAMDGEQRLENGHALTLNDQAKTLKLWSAATVTGNYNRTGLSENSGNGLATAAKLWPTPTSRDYKDGENAENVPVNGLLGRAVNPSPSQGSLNPRFVCWLMGFPKDWTKLEGK